jgi:hypothetical protein
VVLARLGKADVPDGKRRAQRPARIACGGLYPDVLEGLAAEQLAVGHAVEGHAPGHDQVFTAGEGARGVGHAEHGSSVICWMARARSMYSGCDVGLSGALGQAQGGLEAVGPAHGEPVA